MIILIITSEAHTGKENNNNKNLEETGYIVAKNPNVLYSIINICENLEENMILE